MTRRVIVAAAAILALAAAPAWGAEPGIVVGQHVFGTLPCGTPTLERATFPDPMTIAGADDTTCRILLSRTYASRLPADMRCTLVLHEYGHLAGRPHSDDPDSVMYPTYRRPDRRCTTSFSADSRSAPSRARRARGTSGSAKRSG